MYNVSVESEVGPGNIIGKPVVGRDFFGRSQEVEELTRAVAEQHVLMLAPRRVGKTSLMLAVAERITSAQPVYVSVASATCELDLAQAMLHAVYETPAGKELRPSWFNSWMERRKLSIKKIEAPGAAIELERVEHPWQREAEHLFDKLATSEARWLFLIDELPNLVLALYERDPSGARARTFLQWFRAQRQRPALQERVRFVLAGSIGLDAITHRIAGSAAINDLLDWRLGPFPADTARAFLVRVADSHDMLLVPEVVEKLLEETEWLIPYHLQILVSELARRRRSRIPNTEDVTAAVRGMLERKLYFVTWYERLHAVFGRADAELARRVLLACARDPAGASEATLQALFGRHERLVASREAKQEWIMDVLENDGYLVQHGKRWRFRSGLLRRYWLEKFS